MPGLVRLRTGSSHLPGSFVRCCPKVDFIFTISYAGANYIVCQANISSLTLVSYSAVAANSMLTERIALAPWFQPGGRWGGGGYLKVDSSVGSLVDFYNVQFYNREYPASSAHSASHPFPCSQ